METVGAFSELVARINAELGQWFPRNPSLQLRLTATDSESLLQALVPHYQYDGSVSLPVGRHGSGLLSLQTMLLLLEVARVRRAERRNFILAVEEPELHLPPGLQQRVLHRAGALADQLICTTHSPRVAAFCPVTHVRVIEVRQDTARCTPLLREQLPPETINGVRKLFSDHRLQVVEALMYPRVLVPEGRTDYEWLRLLSAATARLEHWRLEDDSDIAPLSAVVGIIPTHDACIIPTIELLAPVRSGLVALVDGDAAGDEYVRGLLGCAQAPEVVLQWSGGQAIEDVIAWVLEADARSITGLEGLPSAPATMRDLRAWLGRSARDGGIKGDYLSYEAVTSVIASLSSCLDRAKRVLRAVCAGALGRTDECVELVRDARTSPSCTVVRVVL